MIAKKKQGTLKTDSGTTALEVAKKQRMRSRSDVVYFHAVYDKGCRDGSYVMAHITSLNQDVPGTVLH